MFEGDLFDDNQNEFDCALTERIKPQRRNNMPDGNHKEMFKSENRSVSARINKCVKVDYSSFKFESDLCRFYVYVDHPFFLNCHC